MKTIRHLNYKRFMKIIKKNQIEKCKSMMKNQSFDPGYPNNDPIHLAYRLERNDIINILIRNRKVNSRPFKKPVIEIKFPSHDIDRCKY